MKKVGDQPRCGESQIEADHRGISPPPTSADVTSLIEDPRDVGATSSRHHPSICLLLQDGLAMSSDQQQTGRELIFIPNQHYPQFREPLKHFLSSPLVRQEHLPCTQPITEYKSLLPTNVPPLPNYEHLSCGCSRHHR